MNWREFKRSTTNGYVFAIVQTAAEILKNETAKTSISISTQFVSTRAQEIGSGDGTFPGLVGIAGPAADTSQRRIDNCR